MLRGGRWICGKYLHSLICLEEEGGQFMELGDSPFCRASLHNLDKQIIHAHTCCRIHRTMYICQRNTHTNAHTHIQTHTYTHSWFSWLFLSFISLELDSLTSDPLRRDGTDSILRWILFDIKFYSRINIKCLEFVPILIKIPISMVAWFHQIFILRL